MIGIFSAFSGFSVSDLAKAKQFYTEVIGLELENEDIGLRFILPTGGSLFIYKKDDHSPASYTVLNFVVKNIDQVIDDLATNGVVMEKYDTMPTPQDDKGVLRGLSVNMEPDIAWFKDPSGNILSVMQV
jgi:catechol 2,3-dioxygenase-like lactoylglutathione lyase family enzyme